MNQPSEESEPEISYLFTETLIKSRKVKVGKTKIKLLLIMYIQ